MLYQDTSSLELLGPRKASEVALVLEAIYKKNGVSLPKGISI